MLKYEESQIELRILADKLCIIYCIVFAYCNVHQQYIWQCLIVVDVIVYIHHIIIFSWEQFVLLSGSV